MSPETMVALTTTQLIAIILSVASALAGTIAVLFAKFSSQVESRASECKAENAELRAQMSNLINQDRVSWMEALRKLSDAMLRNSEALADNADAFRTARRDREETDRLRAVRDHA